MPPLFLSLRLSLPLFLSLPFTSNKRPAGRLSLCLLVGDNRTCPEPKEMNYLPRSLLYSWRKKKGGGEPFSCFTIELTALILHTRLVLRPQMLNAQNNPVSCCWWRCLSPAFQRSIHNWLKKKDTYSKRYAENGCVDKVISIPTQTLNHILTHISFTLVEHRAAEGTEKQQGRYGEGWRGGCCGWCVCVFDYTGMRLSLTSIRLLINLIMKRQVNPRWDFISHDPRQCSETLTS